MIILDCEQGTDEWIKARLGIPTSSCFKNILTSEGAPTKARKKTDPSPREKYMYELAGEKISGNQKKRYYNGFMEMGHEVEPKARQYYELTYGVDVDEVGFCFLDDRKTVGSSPDGLIGDKKGLEIKSHVPEVQIRLLKNGRSRAEHFQQIQGNLWVTGREEWTLMDYSPKLKPIYTIYERDEEFIKKLSTEIELFNEDLSELVDKYKV